MCVNLAIILFPTRQEHTGPGINNGNIIVNVDILLVSSLEREKVVDLFV